MSVVPRPTALEVVWTPSSDEDVTGYLVQWKSGDQEFSDTERRHTTTATASSYRIDDPESGEYTVKVTQQGGRYDGDSYTRTLSYTKPERAAPQALVSNIGKGSPQSVEHNQDRAQAFTTGSGGYVVTSVDVPMGKDPGTAPTFTVAIHADNNGQPGSRLATLTAPETIVEGVNTFTHTGVELAPSTTYFVVLDVSAKGTAFATFVNTIKSDEEDSTVGWTLGDNGLFRTFGSTDAYSSSQHSLVIRINGSVATPSTALVSNTDETAQDTRLINDNAQGFTTGGGSYILTGVDLGMAIEATGTVATFTVAVHADNNGQPGSRLATLTAPQTLVTGLNRFTHTGLALASSTSYFVVVDVSATGTALTTYIRTTSSNDEDSTVGWTIGDDGHYRTQNSTSTYISDAQSLLMRVNGTLANLAGLTVEPVAGKTTELAVSWTAHEGAERYLVQYKTATSAYSSGTTVTTNSHTITGLTADAAYKVRVTAVDTDADPDADVAQAEADGTTPDEMGAISVSAVAGSSTELSASWTDINGETGYLVQWKTGAQSYDTARSHTTAANATSYKITGLTASTPYTVKVTSRISIGGLAANGDSAEGSGTTNAPAAAPGPLVTNTDNSRRGYETFSGADAAQAFTTGSNPTGYTLTSVDFILRGIPDGTRSDGLDVSITGVRPGAARPGTILATLTNPDTLSNRVNTFTHPGLYLEPNTTYYVVIDVVCNAYSFRNGIRLTASHAETGAAGWTIADGRHIQRGAINHRRYGGSWVSQSGTNLLFSVNGATNTQLALRQHSLIDDVLRVLWAPSTESGVTGYLVQWKTGEQSYSTLERSHTAASGDSSHEISGLALGKHTVRLTQQGGAGHGSAQEATVTLHGWPGVVYVDPVAGDARAVDIEWEEVSTAAGYVIQWKPVSYEQCSATSQATVTADNLTQRPVTSPTTGVTEEFPVYRATGLEPKTEYYAIVTAYTADGTASRPDGLSHENFGTTHGELTGLSVSAVDGETTKLNVSWTTPTHRSDTYNVRGYRVQWKTASGQFTDTNTATLGSDATAYQITALTADTEYTVKVTVQSRWARLHLTGDSAEATATTNKPPTGTGQSPPGQEESGPEGEGAAALTGLTAAYVSGKPTQLLVSWDPVPGASTYSVRWKTGSDDYGDPVEFNETQYIITGLSANTSYTVNVAALDADNTLLAEATASGTTEPANTPATGAPTISGTAQVGETLTAATSGVSDADGLTNASFAYQWLADGSDISGATGSGYTPVAGDVGKAISVRVSFTDDAGNAEALTSAATAAVIAANTPASGAPAISGTAQVGETLTADTSGISDADGLSNASFAYQWLSDGSAISGATGSAYTLAAGDVGKAMSVRVSFTDDAGNAETLTSAATAAVAAADPPEDEPAVTFVIYHDPDAGDAAVDRYNQAVKLLKDAQISYSEVKGDVQEDVDRLAGVTDSVIPRFFLGDPTEEGWVSETKVNNGGLRWLKNKVAEMSGG